MRPADALPATHGERTLYVGPAASQGAASQGANQTGREGVGEALVDRSGTQKDATDQAAAAKQMPRPGRR